MRMTLILSIGVLLASASTSWATPEPIAYDWQFDLTVEQVTPHDYIESYGLGQAWIHYNVIADHLNILVTWTDLVGEIEKIHIHGPALPGFNERSHVVDVINDPSEIPIGTGLHTGQFQTVKHLFHVGDDHGSGHGGNYTPERTLEILVSEEAYMLVHTDIYFEGEIRGQLVMTKVTTPEPSTATLVGLGLFGLATRRRATSRS